MTNTDHPIFLESIRLINRVLGPTGLDPLQQQVLERLIHSSGDLELKKSLRFSFHACELAIVALKAGAPILTDTEMAAAAIRPMAQRTLKSSVHSVLQWAPENSSGELTRTAAGMKIAWQKFSELCKREQSPLVIIGSAPTALNALLDLVDCSSNKPSLVVGMPVGFVGVSESKNRLAKSGLAQIRLDGSKGGAALAASSINALLRATNFV